MAILCLLKPQDPHAGDPGLAQAVLEAVGNGAQILSQHDRPVPLGFEFDQAKQVGFGEAEISALRPGCAVRNHP